MTMESKPIMTQKKARKVQQRTIDSKEKLLKAAYELFTEKGYYYTNTKEMVKLAGISTGSFYNYFHDKGDIYCALAQQYLQGSCEAVHEMTSSLTMMNKCEAKEYLTDFIKVLLTRCSKTSKFFDDSEIIAKENVQLTENIQKTESEIIHIIENFLRTKRTHPPKVSFQAMARMMYVTTNETANDMIKIPESKMRDEYIALLVDFIISYSYD